MTSILLGCCSHDDMGEEVKRVDMLTWVLTLPFQLKPFFIIRARYGMKACTSEDKAGRALQIKHELLHSHTSSSYRHPSLAQAEQHLSLSSPSALPLHLTPRPKSLHDKKTAPHAELALPPMYLRTHAHTSPLPSLFRPSPRSKESRQPSRSKEKERRSEQAKGASACMRFGRPCARVARFVGKGIPPAGRVSLCALGCFSVCFSPLSLGEV